ncbi:MAG: GlxA family transcriptional regulator [Paracoccaceae bacterium]
MNFQKKLELKSFVFVLINDFSLIAFSNAIEPLRLANRLAQKELYSWKIASETGERVKCSSGFYFDVDSSIHQIRNNDYLIFCSGENIKKNITKTILNWIRKESRKQIYIGSICTGTYILAKAGIINDVSSTIHWENRESLKEEFEYLNITDSIYTIDKKRFSAAGGTASIDLMLNIISQDYGVNFAKKIADQVLHDSIRTEFDRQLPLIPNRVGVRNPRILNAIQIMEINIEEPLKPSDIAIDLGISLRQLERLFQRFFKLSPKNYYMKIRLQKARHLLLQTEMNVLQIAMATGFTSSSHFSKCYKLQFNITPFNERGFSNKESSVN